MATYRNRYPPRRSEWEPIDRSVCLFAATMFGAAGIGLLGLALLPI